MSQVNKFVVIEVTEQEPYGDVIGIFETADAVLQFIEDTFKEGGSTQPYIRHVIDTISRNGWVQLARGHYLRVQVAKYFPYYLQEREYRF